MQSTIGEIIDDLSPYCNKIEMSVVKGFPFIRAYVANSDGIVRCFMYVKQIDEHLYAACDDHEDLHGRRFFPTGSISKPFVTEQDLIHSWFSCNTSEEMTERYKSVRNRLTHSEFLSYMYERLIEYQIICLDPKLQDVQISGMDFDSIRIRRTIDRIMKGYGYRLGTIGDLFELVMIKKKAVNLEELKSKEIQVLVSKLKRVGLDCSVENRMITSVMPSVKSRS